MNAFRVPDRIILFYFMTVILRSDSTAYRTFEKVPRVRQ